MKKTNSLFICTSYAGDDLLALSKDHPLTLTAEANDGRAKLHIEGVIYSFDHVYFKDSIDELIDAGIEDVDIYINSPGGNVFAANQIANEIDRFKGRINGRGGAVVASAATLIASYCDRFEMPANGQYMYHKPTGTISGNEDDIESRLKLLKNITDQYRGRYAEMTGKTPDEIEALWSKGDVWMTAKEAKDEGFITDIAAEKEKITKETALMMAACGAPHTPKPKTKTKIKTEMENRDEIIAKLHLAKDATDEQILTALDELNEKAEKAEKLTAIVKNQKDQAIAAMIGKAIEQKKITADQKETYRALAEKDYDSTKAALESMQSVEKVSAKIDGKPGNEARANWTMDDYLDNDPEALEALAENDPDKFDKLEKAYLRS